MTKKPPEQKQPTERLAVFFPEFCEDLQYWVQADRKLVLRTVILVEAILREPFQGIGKPEPLKHILAGAWPRRLTQEHRIVYVVKSDCIEFLQAQYHY